MTTLAAILAGAAALGAAGAARSAEGAAQPAEGAAQEQCGPWPHWNRYVERFISPDGRVLDHSAADRTTSEGQSYALFFALVANDRPLFERVLGWTGRNLAQGDLQAHLPSWNWGKRRDQSWGTLDANPASDADLWIAYSLLEAARLWNEPGFEKTARAVLANVAGHEVATLAGLGPMLLPGPAGFTSGRGTRLNPSYQPPQLLRRFASAQVPGPWKEIQASSARMLRDTAGRGAVADWILYRPQRGFSDDPVHGAKGSYDAIRSYLWVGMLPAGDPAQLPAVPLLRALDQTGRIPEQIDVRSLQGRGEAPVGFAGALLPLARARGDTKAVDALEARLSNAWRGDLYGDPPAYYDQNLILFGKGFADGRFRFAADGRLVPAWEASCGKR